MAAISRAYPDARSVAGSAQSGEAVTPSNSTDLSILTRALYVGTGGDLTVTMAEGGDLTFVGVAGGSMLALRVSRVKATGTTADDIIALW
jgi:hypothetical protein